MDEIFGSADFSNVEDVGIAAKEKRDMEDPDHAEDIHVPAKV